ncbi:hypothetical protein [Streptomyces sp. NBC_01187]|uniref:hypothetical protein n=1 Tax=Streptomyces sp. NBC_01187 TaxID=2903766 RepID=UPI00386EF651|nr:hypothetical protein OG220_06280 [Streptomyces sp. NBC_01187]
MDGTIGWRDDFLGYDFGKDGKAPPRVNIWGPRVNKKAHLYYWSSGLWGAMSAWWRMQCEEAHQWEVYLMGESEPGAEQLLCEEDGEPAVTATRLPLADRAVITIMPATWERGGGTGREDQYFIEVRSSRNEEEFRRLEHPISWEQAVKFASLLKGIPWSRSAQRWDRFSPDRKKREQAD